MLKLEIIGHLGADARVVRGNDGEYTAFNVAHSVTNTDTQTGESKENTVWVSVTVNRNVGSLLPYLKKGTRVFVRGNMATRLYVGHDGQKHAGINLYAQEIELCSSRTTLTDVCEYIDLVPEHRQFIYEHLWKYADQNQNNQDAPPTNS